MCNDLTKGGADGVSYTHIIPGSPAIFPIDVRVDGLDKLLRRKREVCAIYKKGGE